MKKLINILLLLTSLIVPAAAQTSKISAEPTTNAANAGDDLILNTTNIGLGTYVTHRISITNLVKSAAVTNTLATVALVQTATNRLGTMAFQPTNGPVTRTLTNYGPLLIGETGVGSTNNDAKLDLGTSGADSFEIWVNNNHGVEPETQFSSYGSVSWTIGLDGRGLALNHFGGSGAYHSVWYYQYDDLGLTNAPGHSTPSGFATHLNSNTVQTEVFAFWSYEQVADNITQKARLNWHNSGTPGPGFNQPLYNGPQSVSFGIGDDTTFMRGAEITNTITRGNSSSVPGATNLIDFSYTGSDSIILKPTAALTLAVTNLLYSNTTIVKDIIVQAPFAAVPLTLPTNWLTLTNGFSPGLTTNAIPTNAPGSNDLHIHLLVNCATTTNIYASYSLAYDPPVYDVDALKFITASGITGSNSIAVNQLVLDLKASNVWSQWDCLYPFIGGTTNTCSWNLKDTNSFRIGFLNLGTGTIDATGWLTDGSACVADTGFNPSSGSPNYTVNSGALFVYCGTATPGTPPATFGCFIGAFGGGAYAALDQSSSTAIGIHGLNSGSANATFSVGASGWQGSIIASRTAAGSEFSYGTVGPGTGSEAAVSVPTRSFMIGGINEGDGASVDHPVSAVKFEFAGIGAGLSQSQYIAMSNIVFKFETALARQ